MALAIAAAPVALFAIVLIVIGAYLMAVTWIAIMGGGALAFRRVYRNEMRRRDGTEP